MALTASSLLNIVMQKEEQRGQYSVYEHQGEGGGGGRCGWMGMITVKVCMSFIVSHSFSFSLLNNLIIFHSFEIPLYIIIFLYVVDSQESLWVRMKDTTRLVHFTILGGLPTPTVLNSFLHLHQHSGLCKPLNQHTVLKEKKKIKIPVYTWKKRMNFVIRMD